MSSVSSAGQADIAQLLQQVRSSQVGQTRTRATRPEPTPEMKQKFEAKLQSMADELGIDSSTFAKIGGEIKDAIATTRQDNKGLSHDEMKAKLDSAINDVLTKNGVDPAEFKAKFAELRKSMGGPQGAALHNDHDQDDGNAQAAGAVGQAPVASNAQTPDPTDMIARFFSHMPAGSFVDQAA